MSFRWLLWCVVALWIWQEQKMESVQQVVCEVVETGEVPGLVAVSAGLESGLRAGLACRFWRAAQPVGQGRVWFALERFASVRIEDGSIELGDSVVVWLDGG